MSHTANSRKGGHGYTGPGLSTRQHVHFNIRDVGFTAGTLQVAKINDEKQEIAGLTEMSASNTVTRGLP